MHIKDLTLLYPLKRVIKIYIFLIQLHTTKLLLKEMYVHTHYILFYNSLTFVHDSLLSTGLLAGGAIGAEDVKTNEKVQVAVAGKEGNMTYKEIDKAESPLLFGMYPLC
ncbi:Uncharacterised protein [Streptococcus pneumoniae]|nr:Uncharacterised protein [Streptococcus pneumoniae]COT37001.1 Uncharacterised protein [Streptococcus pneumoniae]SUV13615.1 Uncharacterised protein [Bacillus cereus]